MAKWYIHNLKNIFVIGLLDCIYLYIIASIVHVINAMNPAFHALPTCSSSFTNSSLDRSGLGLRPFHNPDLLFSQPVKINVWLLIIRIIVYIFSANRYEKRWFNWFIVSAYSF